MKRDTNLQPLSRQHHQGLMMVLLLQKGLKKNADPAIMQQFIRDEWQADLASHFQQEEEVLLPMLAGKPFNAQLTARILQDHATIRELVSKAGEGALNEIEINYFSELLEQHIRFEERVYFPEAEKVLSAAELQQIGNQLTESPRNCMDYPVKFWD